MDAAQSTAAAWSAASFENFKQKCAALETERDRYRKALEEIEGSPSAGIGCEHQRIARAALDQKERS